MNVFQLFGRIGLDDREYQVGLDRTERDTRETGRKIERSWQQTFQKIQQHMSSVGKSLQTMGQRWSLFVTAPIVAMGAAAIKAGSDAEETANKFAVVFRDVRAEADQTARNLRDNYGLSSRAAQQLLADTGDLLTGFGFTGEAALDLSSQVQSLAVDLASFTNFSGGAEGASAALTKALLGERESIKSLGLAISEEDVQLELLQMRQEGISIENERQAKAWATLRIAQRQSKNALGDFQRSQDAFANQLRIVRGRLEDVVAAFGEQLLPMVSKVLEHIGRLIERFNGLTDGQRGAIIKVALALAAAGPLMIGLGALLQTIPKITAAVNFLGTAIGKIPKALAAMRAAFLLMTGPVGWLVLAGTIVGGLVALLVGQKKGDRASLEGAIQAVDVAASDADAIEGFEDRFQKLADTLSGPVKRSFEAAKDDIWQIVSNAQSAQEAMARIALGTQLTQQIFNDPALSGMTEGVIRTNPEDTGVNQPFYRLRRALQLGDFDAAAGVVEEMMTSFTQIGDSAAVARLQEFLDDVLAAGAEVESLVAKANQQSPASNVQQLNNSVGDANDALDDFGEGVAEIPETVEGIFKQLGEDGARSVATAQRLIETGYDQTQASLEDLERRSSLLSRARETLLTDHWDEVTDAEIEYLNQRIVEVDAEIARLLKSTTPRSLTDPDVTAEVDESYARYLEFITDPDRLEALLASEVGGPGAGMDTGMSRGAIRYQLAQARDRAAKAWEAYVAFVTEPERVEQMLAAEVGGPGAGMATASPARVRYFLNEARERAAAAWEAYVKWVVDPDRVEQMLAAEVGGPSAGMASGISRGSANVALREIKARVAAEADANLAEYLEFVYSDDRVEAMMDAEVMGPGAGMDTGLSQGNLRARVREARERVQAAADKALAEYLEFVYDEDRVQQMIDAEVGGPGAGMDTGLSPGNTKARLRAARERQEGPNQATEALGQFGAALMNVASQTVPVFGAALQGLAQGGPLGAVVAVFAELLTSSEAFQAIIEAVNGILEPLIGALSKLLDALWPIIDVALTLIEVALSPLIAILENIVAPVFTFVAKVIAGIWNAFATAVNFALGWLGVRLPMVDLEGRRAGPVEWKGEAEPPEPDPFRPAPGAGDDEGGPQGFNAVSQSVQLAVATPLVEASYAMLDAAVSIRNTFTGSGFDLSVLPPFTSAISRITPVLERLLAEGVVIKTTSGSYAHLRP